LALGKLQQFLYLFLVWQKFFQAFLAGLVGGDTHRFGVILKDILNISTVGILAQNDSDRRIFAFDAFLIVEKAKDVEISGALESEGEVTINSKVTVKTDGKILADEADGSKFIVKQGLTIEAGAELEIRSVVGDVDNDTEITNKGLVILNGASIANDVTVNMAADSAVVEVRSFVSDAEDKSVIITDLGMVMKKDESEVRMAVRTRSL